MLRKLALIVAISPAIWFSAAYALGLGEIDVNSHLNQRFSAVIPLNSVSSEDAENLLVRLADSEDFNKAGIERSDYLSSLNFQVIADAKNPRIVVSSKQLAREPFLSFLLDVRSSTGRVLREYTVLLDPPAYSQATPAAATAPAAKSANDSYQTAEESAQSKPQPVAPAPVAAKPAPAPAIDAAPAVAAAPAVDASPSASASATYGPVQAQETFWSIATKLRPNPSVSMDQMLWAIYSNNTQSFEGTGISGLRKGSVLKVPALSVITAVSPVAAKQHLQDLKGRRAAPAKPKAAAPALEPVAPVTKVEPAAPAAKPAAKPAMPATAEKKTTEVVTPPPAAPVKPAPAPVVAAPAKPAAPAPAPTVASVPAPAPAPNPTTPAAPSDSTATVQTEPPATSTPAAVPAAPEPAPAAEPAAPVKQPNSASSDLLIPVIAGVLVLVLGLLGVRHWQKKKDEKDAAPPSVLTPKASSNLQFWKKAAEAAPAAGKSTSVTPPPPPLPVAKVAEKKAEAVYAAPVSKAAPSKSAEAIWDEKPAVATSEQPSYDATETIDRRADVASSAVIAADPDHDVTTKFESETLKMDMDTNDPVSEAEFHLAYGLYDEAALLLESAAEKNPGRTDIRIKLAETYFRASKPHDFDDIAQSLKPQLDAADWQKIAIMGSQLLPDSPLYKGADGGAELGGDVDLAFDEPSDFIDASQTKVFAPAATMAPGSRSNSAVLDFKLEDLESPDVKPASKPSVAAAAAAPSNTLEFNLSDFDLSKPEAPSAVAKPEPEPVATASHSNALEFDLGSFDAEPAKHTATATEAEASDMAEDINLDDFDLGELADDSHAISAGDEAGTKLDLARAYVDMGDNDMARSLLTEVLMQGSEEQKNEAQALIQRLA